MKNRRYLAASLTIAALIVAAPMLSPIAIAQTSAPDAGSARPAQIDPIAVGLAAASATDAEKSQADAIIKKAVADRDAIVPPAAAGDTSPRTPWTPEQREQLNAIQTKELADIKAVLTSDQQAKFQAAYDTARIARQAAPAVRALDEQVTLTDSEKSKVTPILGDYVEQVQKLRQDTTLDRDARQEKTKTLWDAAKAKIRPLLTADQQTTLDGIDSLRYGRGGGGGGGGAR
jgi:hypothetical protein